MTDIHIDPETLPAPEPRLVERDWQDVVLTLVYADGKKLDAQRVRIARDQAEQQQKELARQQARDSFPADHPGLEDALKEIDEWTMSPADFRQQILEKANRLLTSPILVAGAESHELRLLPITAHQGVAIEVKNLESRIVRPS